MLLRTIALSTIAVAMLAGCNQQQDAEVEALKAELAELKQRQITIARRVGLGELVRPDAIAFEDGIKTGSNDAKVAIIEFTDLHCPFCKKFNETVYPQLHEQFIATGQVLFVARELPLINVHRNAGMAAVVARCGAQQDKYKELKDDLFSIGAAGLTKDYLTKVGETFGIEQQAFDDCLKDTAVHNAVTSSGKYATDLGFDNTPVFVIGRVQDDAVVDYEIVVGAKDQDHFAQVIAKYLPKS